MTTRRHYEPDKPKTSRQKLRETGSRKSPFTIKGWRFRVIWKRAGYRPKSKQFGQLRHALKAFRLMGPEPWRYFSGSPDPELRWHCKECEGVGTITIKQNPAYNYAVTLTVPCAKCFGGSTIREYIERRRAELPAMEWVRLEERPMGPWVEREEQWEKGLDQSGATSSLAPSSAARWLAESLTSAAIQQAEETFALPIPETRPERLLSEFTTTFLNKMNRLFDDLGNEEPPNLGER